MKNLKSGFTLIELLIVIAILGILALGLMAALDPIEQLKRARDTATRSAIEEFYNAALRYYSSKEILPWGTSNPNATLLSSVTGTYIQSLVALGELKDKFKTESNLKKIYLTDPTGDDPRVCFAPESKSVRGEPNTYFNQTGGTLSDTSGCLTSGSCYWCAK